jgi:hypothetical protein
MTEEGQLPGGMGDPQMADLRRKVADRVDQALETLSPIQETIRLIENSHFDVGGPVDDSVESLRQEKDQLQVEMAEASRVLNLQLEIVAGLHRQQNSLQQILTKYKRKSAARLEAAVALGKRNRNDNDVEMLHFQCETDMVAEKKTSVGVQCFEFMNEIGEDVGKVREQEKEFARTVEEAFKLLLVGRYTAIGQSTNTKPSKAEIPVVKKGQNPPKTATTKTAVELNIESGAEDEGSIIFDGNLSPTFSDKEATDEKKKRSKRTREKYK